MLLLLLLLLLSPSVPDKGRSYMASQKRFAGFSEAVCQLLRSGLPASQNWVASFSKAGYRLLRSGSPASHNWHTSFGKWFEQFLKLFFPLHGSPKPFGSSSLVGKGFWQLAYQFQKVVRPVFETGCTLLKSKKSTGLLRSGLSAILRSRQTTSKKPGYDLLAEQKNGTEEGTYIIFAHRTL
jgi:hypothetical protein